MCNLFNNVCGVSVSLISKKIAIKTTNSVNVIFLNNFQYDLPFLPSTNTSSTFIFAASTGNAAISKNFSIVQKSRKTHTGSLWYPRLWGLDKLLWFFFKFKYFGKGLKIKKSTSDSLIIFNLGVSHISKLYFNPQKISILRTKKNTYTIVSLHRTNTLTMHDMRRIRPYNLYTRRGLRLSRQPFCKRFGKVSQIASKKR